MARLMAYGHPGHLHHNIKPNLTGMSTDQNTGKVQKVIVVLEEAREK